MLIYLIGFMCAGKTTLARQVAEAACLPFYDTDALIEEHYHLSIAQLFAQGREAIFRDYEHELLTNIADLIHLDPASPSPAAIIATGGGIVLREDNVSLMRQTPNRVIWLNPPFETLYSRLSVQSRPLAQNLSQEQICSLYEERLPYYRNASHHILEQEPYLPQLLSLLNSHS